MDQGQPVPEFEFTAKAAAEAKRLRHNEAERRHKAKLKLEAQKKKRASGELPDEEIYTVLLQDADAYATWDGFKHGFYFDPELVEGFCDEPGVEGLKEWWALVDSIEAFVNEQGWSPMVEVAAASNKISPGDAQHEMEISLEKCRNYKKNIQTRFGTELGIAEAA